MTWSETISNLAYVLVGFLLAAVWEIYKDHRNKNEEAKNVRQILAEEIRYNKAVLQEISTLVRDEERKYQAATERNDYGELLTKADPWRELASFVPDRLSKDAWNSQIQKVPAVLVSNEIAKLFTFYSDLSEIQVLQTSYLDKWSHGSRGMDEPMQKILSRMENLIERPLSIIR